MRILFDFQIFINQKAGGISRYFTDLATGFQKMPDMQTKTVADLSKNIYLNSHSFVPEKLPGRKRAGRVLNRWKVRRLASSFDIIHPTYYNIGYLKGIKTPIITTVHDLVYFKYPEYFPEFPVFKEYFLHALQRSDGIVCISESTRTELLRYVPVGSKPLKVIHHGLNVPAAQTKEDKEKFFLYVGSRHLYKGFEVLLETFCGMAEQYPEYSLIMVGGEPLSERESDVLSRYPQQLKHLSLVSDTVLANLYAHTAALIVTSRDEGFCYPVVEAAMHGSNVICTDIPVLREVAGSTALFFSPGDSAGLRHHLESVIENKGLPQKIMSTEMMRHFSLERMSNDTREFYSRFV